MIACAGVFLIVAALVQGRSTDFRVFGDYDAQDRGWNPDLYREVKTADAAEPGGTVHVYSPDPARLLRNAKHRLAYALVSSAICVALHLWGDAVFPNVPKLAAVIPVFLLSAVLAFASLAAFLEYLRVSR